MTEIAIDIEEKSYPGQNGEAPVLVLNNLQFSLQSGEFVCLVGPSGCGKTSLLHIVAGLDHDFQGSVSLHHTDHAAPRIGYLFQQSRLLPWRTVVENIKLVLRPDQDPALIPPLLEAMGLERENHQSYPERLSGGQARRVALARAFIIEPDLMLMDEPFVSLDAPSARGIRKLLLELRSQRPQSVLFVTHDLREAIALADRLLFLSPSPCRLLLDTPVTLTPQQRTDHASIESFRTQLLNDYSAIRGMI